MQAEVVFYPLDNLLPFLSCPELIFDRGLCLFLKAPETELDEVSKLSVFSGLWGYGGRARL